MENTEQLQVFEVFIHRLVVSNLGFLVDGRNENFAVGYLVLIHSAASWNIRCK
jgi:hypothetical protein